jgi:hypothetical protein
MNALCVDCGSVARRCLRISFPADIPPQQAATEKIRGDSMQGLLMRLNGGEGKLVMACPGAIR